MNHTTAELIAIVDDAIQSSYMFDMDAQDDKAVRKAKKAFTAIKRKLEAGERLAVELPNILPLAENCLDAQWINPNKDKDILSARKALEDWNAK